MINITGAPARMKNKAGRIDSFKATAKAEEFVTAMGFEEMKGVWYNEIDGIAFVNLAPVVNDIVYYPDIVKVKVCTDDGRIIGLEANNYAANHVKRDLAAPKKSAEECMSGLCKRIDITSHRLALIPLNSKEILCREFTAMKDDLTYIIYSDASTGEEVSILRVVDEDQGQMII